MIETTKTDHAKAIGSLSTYKPVVRGPKIFPKDEPRLFINTYVSPILVYPLHRLVAHPYTHATKYPKINVPAYKMALFASTPSTPKIKLIPRFKSLWYGPRGGVALCDYWDGKSDANATL